MRNMTKKLKLSAAAGLLAVPLSVSPILSAPALAQDAGVKSLLGDASDGALDKLSQPGAFYADKAVRVLLPGPLKNATKILRFTSKAGLTKDITKSLNDAAGKAALEAKPVFRSAIDNMTLTDGVGIVTGGGTGGTDYLRKTSGEELAVKIRPLVEKALGEVGAYKQVESLGSISALSSLGGLDLSRDGLTDSVTEQALDGIFSYIGAEEKNFRKNPLKKGSKLLKDIF
ncbi:DUF4197 domain-containing protein [Parasphingorhabdus litoris]|uniref:DUF4197 domain-containing protein n=1 Tax=Parasphingorhabdus litoris TaxID=394733 RepID=A0ABP3L0D8_9SPHN|nr:DUF4197 domain-containing protein [Parasphingorhabdus litoris]